MLATGAIQKHYVCLSSTNPQLVFLSFILLDNNYERVVVAHSQLPTRLLNRASAAPSRTKSMGLIHSSSERKIQSKDSPS